MAPVFKQPTGIWRLGRQLGWASPRQYRWIGIWRHCRDCFDTSFDVWIDGYPRSANTFAGQAFQMANPRVRLRTHCHLPPYIIRALDADKPGIFLIRKPEEAIVSWAIVCSGNLKLALEYYIDFHRVMRPHLPRLHIVTFDQVARSFRAVIKGFNQRFGTNYQSINEDSCSIEECFARVEQARYSFNGKVDERSVCRPSKVRELLKPPLLARLRESPKFSAGLREAERLFTCFLTGKHVHNLVDREAVAVRP